LTFAQFEALEERRKVSIRYDRFNAALVTATLYNSRRSEDSDPVEVWDFLPGFERDPEEVEQDKRRKSTKQAIVAAFGRMEGMSPGRVRAEAEAMILRMSTVEDAAELVRDVYTQVTKRAW
jgi:hypothetical protein